MYKNIYDMKRNKRLVILSEEDAVELGNESLEDLSEQDTDEQDTTVSKIQTLDVVTAVMEKFDININDTKIMWDLYINNGKITNTDNFIFIDDLHVLLNNTFDEKELASVAIFNELFDNLTSTSFAKNLALYGREKYSKPFIAEGLVLLLYELAIDWAVLLIRYFKELPKLADEKDSFFKKFPNLELLTYIAELFNNSNEFGNLITNSKARDLLSTDTEYKLTSDQVQKKPRLYRAKSESLSYYASLVKNNYADIMVGAIDKLCIVAYLSSKCSNELHERLTIIRDLISSVVKRNTATANDADNNNNLRIAEMKAIEILKMRSEARIMLDSNEKNYPLTI